jgi:uncharacterized membrane protein HdeD (DUF308 family)
MRRQISGIIGLAGGLTDLWAGLSILLQSSMGMGPMQGARLLGYFLSALGLVVLLTGMLMFTPRVMSHFTSLLMITYGLIMLVLGVGMISGIFNVMMQWSILSGIVMITLGLLMLYSGSHMSRKRM